jgi:dihydrofolate reductase
MTISIIVAHSLHKRVIGNKGDLPWTIPEDLQFFKTMTTGKAVVMGRKTYESLPQSVRPLPNRKTFILTRNEDYKIAHPDVQTFTDLKKCLMVAKLSSEEVMIAGGEQIYKLCMPYTDRIYATIISGDYEGDAFFPKLSQDEWDKSDYDYDFVSEQLELFYSRVVFNRKKGAPKGA